MVMIAVSPSRADSWSRVLPFNAGNGGPYIWCDLCTSSIVSGQLRIQLSCTTRKNLSLAMWFVLRFSVVAAFAFLISRLLNNCLFSTTVFKNEKDFLNLDMSTEVASYRYRPGRKRLNFKACPSEICTVNASSISVSRVTRY